jgi:hypothetical protein
MWGSEDLDPDCAGCHFEWVAQVSFLRPGFTSGAVAIRNVSSRRDLSHKP